jgi:glucokinase-like ROK family protein
MPQTARFQTGDPSLLRQLNLAVVMHYLRERAPIYRAQLAEITGLNKTTVSSLVSELIAHEYVQESGQANSAGMNARTGRPAVMLELNPAAGCAVAAEVGVDFISVAVANFTSDIIWRQAERTRQLQGQEAIIERLLALLRTAIGHGLLATHRVLGMAVGVPGLVELERSNVLFAPNLNWQDLPLGLILREAFDLPVFLDNEANLAALAEAQYGAARNHQDVLYISASAGLGGGIVRDGQIYRGVSGFAGEFGHMKLDAGAEAYAATAEQRTCGCGNTGCWETYVSEPALFAGVAGRVARGQSSVLSWAARDAGNFRGRAVLTVPLVVDAAQAGDAVALAALEDVGHALGAGIASLVNALNPELVVLGGSLSLAGEFLLPVIRDELGKRALRWNQQAVQVAVAQHRFDACVMGGIATVIQSSQLALTLPAPTTVPAVNAIVSPPGELAKLRDFFATPTERG